MAENSTTDVQPQKKYGPGTPFRDRPLRFKLAFLLGSVWTIYIILTLLKVFFTLGIIIYPVAHRAICAGALVSLVLLAVPPKKGADMERLHWYETVMILWTAAACAYIACNSDSLDLFLGRRHMVADAACRRLFRGPHGSRATHFRSGSRHSVRRILFLLRIQRSIPGIPHEHGLHLRRSHGMDVPERRRLLGQHRGHGRLHGTGLHSLRLHTHRHRSKRFLQRPCPGLPRCVPRRSRQDGRALQHVLRLPFRLRGRQRGHHRTDHHSHDEKNGISRRAGRRRGSRGLHRRNVHPAHHGRDGLPHRRLSRRQLLVRMRRRLPARRTVLRHAARAGRH